MKRGVKRVIQFVGGALLLIVLGLAGLMASAFVGRSSVPEGVVIDGFVHIAKDGFVGVNVIDVGAGHVALIDAGNDTEGKAVLAELTKMGLGPSAVTAIFLTHGHPDHLNGAHLFPAAKIYALASDVALAEGREKGHGVITQLIPVRPTGIKITQALNDGDVISAGNRSFHVFATPGHTAGSAAYWVDGVLFLGDSAGASTDGKLLPAPWALSDSPSQNRLSLKTLDRRLHDGHLDVKTIVPAHCAPLTGIAPLDAFAAAE